LYHWGDLERKKSAIITYHSLDDSGSDLSISPVLFRAHIEILVSSSFQIVPLAGVLDQPGSVAITFDDGYRNFFQVALPLLAEYRIPATVFVISGYCGRYNDWRSRMKTRPRLEMLSWQEVREISDAGVAIGAHTVNHADLTMLPPGDAARELRDCRSDIEDRIGRPVDTLAYPWGATSAAVCEFAKREFRLACGAGPQFVGPEPDPFDLPRIDASYLRKLYWLSNLDNGLGSAYVAAQRSVARVRASLAKST
jgi:peptidoglycan/xylan/chitin deacetylase (PgdA/CDA1 family)